MSPAPIAAKRIHPNASKVGNDSTFYVQFGGGSPVLAIGLGLVGGMISASSIKSRTAAQAGSIASSDSVDPRVALAEMLSTQGPRSDSGLSPVTVTPFVLYVNPKKSPDVERRLVLEISCDGWLGWYSYHLSAVPAEGLKAASPEYFSQMAADLRAAAQSLLSLARGDALSQARVTEQRQVQSWQLNPMFAAAMPQGLRGTYEGRAVVVGQGTIEKDQPFLVLMKGVQLLEPSRITLGKPY